MESPETTEFSYPKVSLFVGNLDPDVDDLSLIEKFSKIGPLSSVHVCRDKDTSRSLGYGYVNFENSVDAETALHTLNSQKLIRKPMRIMWYQRNPALRKSGVGNIIIRNIDTLVDDEYLFEKFSRFGNIMSYTIARDENGFSKGYGFVHFETETSASKAIDEMNNTCILGQKVFVTKHVPRQIREKNSKNEGKLSVEEVWPNYNSSQDKKKVQDLINLLQTELQCSICHELFKEPCITDCGHIFCDECIVEWKNQNCTCPTCRAALIKPEKKVFEMNNFIVKATELLLSGNTQS